MKNLINQFPEQLNNAVTICENNTKKSSSKDTIGNVVIAGFGGSGIGTSIVKELIKDELSVPLELNQAYTIPKYIDQHTLFIASTYSGNTEETITCLNQAIDSQAQCVVISTGGKAIDQAKKHNLSHYIIPYTNDCPRANIGYALVFLLYALQDNKLISFDINKEVSDARELLLKNQAEIVEKAKNVAQKLHSQLPIVYAGSFLYPVALRFQQQINENAKQLCHANKFSEMNHNELVGWKNPTLHLENSQVIYLSSDFDYQRNHKRMELCNDIFTKITKKEVLQLHAKGSSPLSQMVYLIHQVDWCSYFLALENSEDIMSVEAIDKLKKELTAI